MSARYSGQKAEVLASVISERVVIPAKGRNDDSLWNGLKTRTLMRPGRGLAPTRRYGSTIHAPLPRPIVARARFIEDLLVEQANRGLIDQYVILGAGLDSFAQRRPDTPSDIVALAREAGFGAARHVSAADLTQRYFAHRTAGLRPPNNAQELLVATT